MKAIPKDVRQNHLKGYVMILAASIMFGTYGIWSKLMGTEFAVFFQGWTRALLVMVMLFPIMVWKKMFVPIRKIDQKWLAIICVFTVFTQAPLYYAYTRTGIAAATLMFYGMFIITSYVVGRFMIREAVTGAKIFALILAFVGMGLVFRASTLIFSTVGLLMAAVNGVASGGEVSSTKRVSNSYPVLLITFYAWLAIFVTHLPMSLVLHEKQLVPAFTTEWLAVFVYAVVSLVSFWLVVEGFRYVDASIGSLIGLAEIVWAMLFGVIFFHEQITFLMIIGAVLILAAGMLPDTIRIIEPRRMRT